MRFDKFTMKAQEAISESQNIAGNYEHQQIEPEHILMALTLQQEGIVTPILQKLGVDPAAVLKQLEELITKIPKVYGGGMDQVYISPRSKKVFDQSFKEAERLKDEYVRYSHIHL